MPTINELPADQGVDPGDFIPVWDEQSQSTRKVSASIFNIYIQSVVQTYLAQHPVQADPTLLAAAVADYLEAHPPKGEITSGDIQAALDAYLADNPLPAPTIDPALLAEAINGYLLANPPKGTLDPNQVEQFLTDYLNDNPPQGVIDPDQLSSLIAQYLTANPPKGQIDQAELIAEINEYLRLNPPAPLPPTAEQIKAGVDAYLSANPPVGQIDPDQINQAVSDYLTANPPSGVTPDAIASAVADYIEAHPQGVPTFADLDALRLATVSRPGEAIYLAGVAKRGVGSGWFVYDDTDTTSVDDGALVVVTQTGKRLKRVFEGAVQASWFGVYAVGTKEEALAVDCRQALLRAWRYGIKTGKTIEMPAGFVGIGSGVEPSQIVGGNSTGSARLLFVAGKDDLGCVINAYGCTLIPADIAPDYDALDPSYVTLSISLSPAADGTYPAGTVFSIKLNDTTLSYTAIAGDTKAKVIQGMVSAFAAAPALSSWVANNSTDGSTPVMRYRRTKVTNNYPSSSNKVNVVTTARDGWYDEPRIFQFFGSGSGRVGDKFAPTDNNCPFPPMTIRGLGYDYFAQSYKGGTAANPGVNHAKPFGNGSRLLDVQYAVYFQLIDCTFQNHYGNGIRFAKCYRSVVSGCVGQDVSANQVVSPVGSAEDTDHTGGFFFGNGCYANLIENCTIRNTRVFEADYVTPKGDQTKGGICGYIGAWFEFGIQNETVGSSGNDLYARYVPHIMFNLNPADTSTIYTTDKVSAANTIRGCLVEGYTLGVKVEADSEMNVYDTIIRNCYIPAQASHSRMRMFGCTLSFGDCDTGFGKMVNPQRGYATYTALVNAKDFDPDSNRIRDTQLGYAGASPVKAGVTLHSCTLTTKNGPVFSAATTGINIEACTIVIDGAAPLFNISSPNRMSAGLNFIGNTVILTANHSSAGWFVRGQDGARIAYNSFINLNAEKVFNLEFGNSQNSASDPTQVAMDGRGYYLFEGNRTYGAFSLRSRSLYAMVKSRNNNYYAWRQNSAKTYPTLISGQLALHPISIYTGNTNNPSSGFVSDGDTFMVKPDFTGPVIYDAGINSIIHNATFRFVDLDYGEVLGTTGLADSLIKSFSPGELDIRNVRVLGNATRKIPLLSGGSTASKGWGWSIEDVRDDSADAPLIANGNAVSGPVWLKRNRYGKGIILFALNPIEPNKAASLSTRFVPAKAERLEYVTVSDLTQPVGAIWNGSVWVEYKMLT